jgi:predicted dehydrogenase
VVQAGTLGPIKEVHVWTNRPIWDQAPKVMSRYKAEPIPKEVHWDEFIGPSPVRDYAKKYQPFQWRGWWDFGTGALGDMACHTANMAFMALKLGSPTSIVSDATDVNPETCPSSAHIVFEFPARGALPPVTFHWYEGKKNGQKLLPPKELVDKVLAIDAIKNSKKPGLVDSGSIMVGEKGILYSPDDYGAKIYLTPEKEFAGLNLTKPEKFASNNGGDTGQKKEWFEAIKQNKPELAFSNFDYAGMLTEAILLGNVASRVGKKLTWDAEKMVCPGNPEASQYIKLEARKGWGIDDLV